MKKLVTEKMTYRHFASGLGSHGPSPSRETGWSIRAQHALSVF
jgi:hypothetical protein